MPGVGRRPAGRSAAEGPEGFGSPTGLSLLTEALQASGRIGGTRSRRCTLRLTRGAGSYRGIP